jgi:hypothetical protein
VGVLLAFSAVTASPAEGDLRIDLVPAWEGVARPGAVTELEIRLNAGRAGDYVLELSGGEAPLRVTASTGPGGAATLWVPYRAAADPFVGVTAYRDGQPVGRAEQRIHHVISGSQVVAVSLVDRSRASKMDIALPKSVVLNASPNSLPRTPQAYDAIDLLVLDAASLSALDDVRLSALQGYLGGCGKLIVERLPDNGVQRLRSLSGCGGRFIGIFDDAAPLTLGALRLLEAPTAPLPRAVELARARNPDLSNDIYLPIVVFLCVYLLIMPGTALTTRKALPLLLVPVLAAALAVFAWRERPPRSELIIWSESGGQNAATRYAALLSVIGAGPATATLGFPPGVIPRNIPADDVRQVRTAEDAVAGAGVEIHTRLLSRTDLYFQGAYWVSPPVAVSLVEGKPAVRNLTASTLNGVVLSWKARRVKVPALAAGEGWRYADTADDAEPRLEGLLEERGRADGPAVLLPFESPVARQFAGDLSTQSWLLVRSEGGSG